MTEKGKQIGQVKNTHDKGLGNQEPDIVTDQRFESLHWDPRFSRVPKNVLKLKVDERFKDPLQKNIHFRGNSAPVDRYGRLKNPSAKGVALDHLYDIADSDDDGDDSQALEADMDGEENERNELRTSDGQKNVFIRGTNKSRDHLKQRARQARCSTQISSLEDMNRKNYGAQLLGEDDRSVESSENVEEKEEESIPLGKATSRLAVIGLDWSRTRAVDIFAGLQSFCPPGKLLKSVKVYPSKLGIERLALEATLGPQFLTKLDMAVVDQAAALHNNKDSPSESIGKQLHAAPEEVHDACLDSQSKAQCAQPGDQISESEGSESSSEAESEVQDICADVDYGSYEDSNDGEENSPFESGLEVDARLQNEQEALRKYEEDRLKYYYAIATFDDAKTAEVVYDQCDGVEFESSGLALDLRFVPEDMPIDVPARDGANEIPDGYKPPNLVPSTLNNSTVKLSWDADAPDRAILKKKRFNKHDEDDINLKAYLADSSDEDRGTNGADPDEEHERKRMMLLGCGEDDDPGNDEEMEMEISFDPGLLEKGEQIVKRKDTRDARKHETPWEARLRRMQERKAEKRKFRNNSSFNPDAEVDHDDEMSHYADIPQHENSVNTGADSASNSSFDDAYCSSELSGPLKPKNLSKLATAVNSESSHRDGLNIQAEKHDAKRRQAELELLLMTDDRKFGQPGEGSLRERLLAVDSEDDSDTKSRRLRRQGRTRGRRRTAAEAVKVRDSQVRAEEVKLSSSVVDVKDDRFDGLYSSHLFAMDPTHPKFKRNETTQRILAEKERRGRQPDKLDSDLKSSANTSNDDPDKPWRSEISTARGKDDENVMILAANLKARSAMDSARSRKTGKRARDS